MKEKVSKKEKLIKFANSARRFVDVKIFASLLGIFFGGTGVAFAYSWDALDHGMEHVNKWGDLGGTIGMCGLVCAGLYFLFVFIVSVVADDLVDDVGEERLIDTIPHTACFFVMVLIALCMFATHTAAEYSPTMTFPWIDEIYTALKIGPALLVCFSIIDLIESLAINLREASNDNESGI